MRKKDFLAEMKMEETRKTGMAVIDSYERRVKTVLSFVRQAARLVEEKRRDTEEMALLLRENLAKHNGLRKKDFNSLMERSGNNGTEIKVRELLLTLESGEGEMVSALRKVVVEGEQQLLEKVKNEMLPLQKEREKAAARLIMLLQMEDEEFRAALKMLLSKGGDIRIRDFKNMTKVLKARQGEETKDVREVFETCRLAAEDAAARWHGLLSLYEAR